VQTEGIVVMSRRITALTAAAVTLVLATGIAAAGANGVKQGQAPPQTVAPPSISGTPQVPNTLAASTGTWQGNGLKYAYQWLACDSTGAKCSALSGATSSNESLGASLVGDTLRVVVTASNHAGSAAATSAATGTISGASTPPPPPPPTSPSNSSPPTVSGTPQQGQTLSAATGSWSGTTPITYTYQWQRCDSAGNACTAISGATAATYALASADVGSTARVSVTASNSAGSATASSAATAVVTAQATPVPAGAWWTWAAPNYTLGWTNASSSPDHWQAAVSNSVGGLNSNNISTVSDGSGGSATRLKIAPVSQSTTSGTMTSLYNPMPDRSCQAFGQNAVCGGYTEQGQDAWYRWKVRFPSGAYVPRLGDWNINVEWHESSYGSTATNCPHFTSPYFGIQADGSNTAYPGTNPRLIFHFRSGQVNSTGTGITNDFVITERNPDGTVKPLQYDHWYDVVAHYKWEPNNTGAFEWFVDGRLQYRNLAITTMHIFCDGTSYPGTFAIYNYQRNDGTWPSGVDFQQVDIGPTAASVGLTQ
jgi:Polysaccharide lyase